jgi:uncharacterized protein
MFDLEGKKTITNVTEVQRDFGRILKRAQQSDVVIIRNNQPVGAFISLRRLGQLPTRALQRVPMSARHFVKVLEHAPQKVRQEFVSVILFGSYARGEQHEDSDVDLLVLVKKLSKSMYTLISQWSTDAMEATGYQELLVAIPRAEAYWQQLQKQGVLFAREVQRDGIVLWKNSTSP